MRRVTPSDGYILVTGATGFLGHYVLAELLGRHRSCIALLRPPIEHARERLAALLHEIAIDHDEYVASGALTLVEGDITGAPPDIRDLPVRSILHIAASTSFAPTADGDPARTNVDGTENVLRWADAWGVSEFHLISTAYVCGETEGTVREAAHTVQPRFHNHYERSKWEAERLCMRWANDNGRRLTVYRPSIIVGDFHTGRATRFGGIYLSARATEMLHRIHIDSPDHVRRALSVRIAGRADGRQNIVPVDYVARFIGCVAGDPAHQNRVYHLVHPDAPTNGEIKEVFEHYFKIGGGRFVEPEHLRDDDLNELERQFHDATASIRHYLQDTPAFDRRHAEEIERTEAIVCPHYAAADVGRLIRHAQAAGWGRRRQQKSRNTSECAEYFESFLPTRMAESHVAETTAVTATIRFVIEDEPNGEWTCFFNSGVLTNVRRGPNGIAEDFGYRTNRDVFWEATTGRTHPQEFFLTGKAEVFGDVERALKMAMILHAFANEFPCHIHDLEHRAEESCANK